MSKTPRSAAAFEPNVWYLGQVKDVQWQSLPTIGNDPFSLAIKISFNIFFRIKEPRSVDLNSSDAAVYVIVKGDLLPFSEQGKQFLKAAGIHVKASCKPTHQHSVLRLRFGIPDSVFHFQPIIEWDLSTPEEIQKAALMIRTRSRLPFSLSLDYERHVARRAKSSVEFGSHRNSWEVFTRLARRYPEHYRPEALVHDVWDIRTSNTSSLLDRVYATIRELRQFITDLGLIVESCRGLGYRLEDRHRSRKRPR